MEDLIGMEQDVFDELKQTYSEQDIEITIEKEDGTRRVLFEIDHRDFPNKQMKPLAHTCDDGHSVIGYDGDGLRHMYCTNGDKFGVWPL